MKINIFSPSASEPLGHPLYVQKMVNYIVNEFDIELYTLKHKELNSVLIKLGAQLRYSSVYCPGEMDKNNFLRYGRLYEVIYGLKRIYISYKLLIDFYNGKKTNELFHLLEFEYFSCFFFFLFHPKALKRTILGFHAADFAWVGGRSIVVNLYKSFLKWPIKFLVQGCFGVTTMGITLRETFIENLRIENLRNKIHISGYGSDVNITNLDKGLAREKLNLDFPKEKRIALFFGVLRRDKGILDLLNAMKNIDTSVQLLVAGGIADVSESEIYRVIKENEIEDRVTLRIGFVKEEEIKYYFGASDFVFLTHKGSFYSFSGPLSLSVENSRPVVASKVGEIGNFVTRFNLGQTFLPENINDLTNVTNTFINKLNSSTYGFENATNYNSWKEVAGRVMQIYKS